MNDKKKWEKRKEIRFLEGEIRAEAWEGVLPGEAPKINEKKEP